MLQNLNLASKKIIIKRGFNLVEASIALLISALVIGAIWSASSSVNENQKINRTDEVILKIVSGARKLYDLHEFPSSALNINRNTVLINTNIIPDDFLSNGLVISPWGNAIDIYQSYSPGMEGGSATPELWRIQFTNLPESTCRQLIIKVSSRYRNTKDLTFIQTVDDGVYTGISTLPVLPNKSILCPSGSDKIVNYTRFLFAARPS